MLRKYFIPLISAHSLINASSERNVKTVFRLDMIEQGNSSAFTMTEQDDCAFFFKAEEMLRRIGRKTGRDSFELSRLIVYVDFSGIFDRSSSNVKTAQKQAKAEAMFSPDGILLDVGYGDERYISFERSASMSRDCRLSFVNAAYYAELHEWMTLGMTIGKCQLSKLYAYNGLIFTSGDRIADSEDYFDSNSIVIVDNPKTVIQNARIVTVKDDGSSESVRRYDRIEKTADVEVLEFDGEGIVCNRLADSFGGEHHSSFQIRMPYIKGVVHRVDFASLFRELGVDYIIDIWGVKRRVDRIAMILTKSMFKGFSWMTENGLTWDEYLGRCKSYDHAIYVTGRDKAVGQTQTELNYQFIVTAAIKPDEFRPLDLPDGWECSPLEEGRDWITRETELTYYCYVADKSFRRQYFLDKLKDTDSDRAGRAYIRARIIEKNELFINEPIYVKELEDRATSILENYGRGNLLISGDNRYLSGDLMRFLYILAETVSASAAERLKAECLEASEAYMPGAEYPKSDVYTLLRNPHIARNEEALVTVADEGELRKKYLSHLRYLVMVDSRALIPERLGGADFDGDMVRTIADPLMNSCVMRNYCNKPDGQNGIPILKIPTAEPLIRDADDWHARFETVRGTFSSRIGQICNAAFNRSVIAYDESISAEERAICREETETLSILTGLEIDSAKSGIKPDLSAYLGAGKPKHSLFLKYKGIVGDKESRRWYEDSKREKLDKFYSGMEWSDVTSNIERLPYLKLMLEKNTPKIKPVPASDEELFTFAQVPDWKDKLDVQTIEYMRSLIADYEEAKRRIRAIHHMTEPNMKRKNDVTRILYSRGQDDRYTAEELYAAFSSAEPSEVTKIYNAVRANEWHLTPKDKRSEFLYEYCWGSVSSEYFELLSDFRAGGYRVLWDIVCDYNELYSYNAAKALNFTKKTDSAALAFMLRSVVTKSDSMDELAAACATVIREAKITNETALMCAVTLGKRDFALEVMPYVVEKFVVTTEKKKRRGWLW